MKAQRIRVIDFFSGCGGMSYGFAQATVPNGGAFDVLGGVDINTHANRTYERMMGVGAIERDVRKLSPDDCFSMFPSAKHQSEDSPLVVIGCAPCQGFSAHRKKDIRKDSRNSLLGCFSQIAVSLKPEFIVMENVPEMLDQRHWHHYAAAVDVLSKAGYRVRARIYNLADFGVPQARFRALVIARRAGRPFDMPLPTHLGALRTVRDAIGDLPRLQSGECDPVDPMHRAPNHTKRILNLIRSVPANGGSRRDARLSLLPKCHGSVDGFRDVYGRLEWDNPSISITAKCSTPSCGRFLHPEQHRSISVREAALLQGFPPNYIFDGPLTQQYRQIGEAVSPIFARIVAEHLAGQLRTATTSDDVVDDVNQPLQKSFASRIASIKKSLATEPTGTTSKDHSLTVIDCFAGAGGLSGGLHAAGFQPVYAFDSDPYAVTTYRNNVAACIEHRSASEVTPEHVLQRTGLRPGECTLVAGGPPCQGFSQQRRGPRADSRNSLVLWYADFVVAIRPSFFLLENVTYLKSVRGISVFDDFCGRVARAGYSLTTLTIDARDFGVAQARRRIIVLGYQQNLGFSLSANDIDGGRQRRTVRDAIGTLPSPPLDGNSEHPDYANHKRVKISSINEMRISFVPQGGGWKDIPRRLQLPCHKRHRGQGHIDVYGRLSWNGVSRTITALCDNFSRGPFAHPAENRVITSREAAALQSFPHDYRFYGPKKDVARQIGNAVPPLVAKALGQAIVRAMMRSKVTPHARRRSGPVSDSDVAESA